MPVTGAGPNCSLLANALERGYGITPPTDHFGAVTRLVTNREHEGKPARVVPHVDLFGPEFHYFPGHAFPPTSPTSCATASASR